MEDTWNMTIGAAYGAFIITAYYRHSFRSRHRITDCSSSLLASNSLQDRINQGRITSAVSPVYLRLLNCRFRGSHLFMGLFLKQSVTCSISSFLLLFG